MRFLIWPDGVIDQDFLNTPEKVAAARKQLEEEMKEEDEKNKQMRRIFKKDVRLD